jgi:hypothetical protein
VSGGVRRVFAKPARGALSITMTTGRDMTIVARGLRVNGLRVA